MYRTQEALSFRSGRFAVKIAEHHSELQDALRLRFEVFNEELKEGLASSFSSGLDWDEYDSYCDHLIVVDTDSGRVVGTYRLLPGFVAENNIGYYSEGEFELTLIKSLPGEKLELGRSCVHRDYRNTRVISLLWSGIARYVDLHNMRHLFGCASLHTSNPEEVCSVYSYLRAFHHAEHHLAVTPLKKPAGFSALHGIAKEEAFDKMPPLVKGYVRLGAKICGEPAYDEEFGTTDFFFILDVGELLSRYKKKYFSEQAAATAAMAVN